MKRLERSASEADARVDDTSGGDLPTIETGSEPRSVSVLEAGCTIAPIRSLRAPSASPRTGDSPQHPVPGEPAGPD